MKKLALFLFGLGSLIAVSTSSFANTGSGEPQYQDPCTPCAPAPCPADTVCNPAPCNPAPCNPAPCNPAPCNPAPCNTGC